MSLPAADSREWLADEGIELVVDEPVEIARARAGGLKLHDGKRTAIRASSSPTARSS